MAELPGPRGPIPYQRDQWGYPRIEAWSFLDGTWARGWFHATDRRFQVELLRYVGEGRLMEILGPERFARVIDRNVRVLGLGNGLAVQEAKLTDAARAMCEAYCAGFNASGRRLPLPCRALGIEDRPWTVRDVLLTYRLVTWFGLTSLTQTGRVAVGQLIAGGVDAEFLTLLLGPGAEGIDLAACTDLQWKDEDGLPGLTLQYGSNAFAVSAERSTTGASLLMTEFHMEVARFPPVMHISNVHYANGGYVQGVSVPGLPIFSAGRTADVGWGFTFGHADNVDVTLQRCRENTRLFDGEWRDLKRRAEVVKVRGKSDETFVFWDFDGGSILGDPSGEEHLLPGIAWRGLESTFSDINAHIGIHTAKSAAEALDLHAGVVSCSLAGVYVDKEHIAWIHGGRVPVKRSGWGPRPGWDLTEDPDIAFADWPQKIDPSEGYIASANERCPGWTAFPEPCYRHLRQCELLEGDRKLSPTDLMAISYDEYDGCAARLAAVWADLVPETAKSMIAWATTQTERNTPVGRVHMGRFHALHHEVLRRLLTPFVGKSVSIAMWDDLDLIMVFQDHLDDVLALEHPAFLGAEALAKLLGEAWPAAVRRARADLSSGPVRTRHKNLITQGRLPVVLGFSSPPRNLPGGPTCLFASRRHLLLGEEVITGPAFHMVIDMAVEGLQYNICGGASERRWGPGYGTGVEEWLRGKLATLS